MDDRMCHNCAVKIPYIDTRDIQPPTLFISAAYEYTTITYSYTAYIKFGILCAIG